MNYGAKVWLRCAKKLHNCEKSCIFLSIIATLKSFFRATLDFTK